MQYLTLTPAYGRDYASKRALLEDWTSNRDFLVCDMSSPYDGKPVNKADLERTTGPQQVQIRYKRLERIAVIRVN